MELQVFIPGLYLDDLTILDDTTQLSDVLNASKNLSRTLRKNTRKRPMLYAVMLLDI